MHLNSFKILFAIVLILGLLSGLFFPAHAQTSPPDLILQAEAAYEGNVKYGEWAPVWVTLENPGADVSGEVVVRVTGSAGTIAYTVPVELPGGARKRLPVFVLPNNFSRRLSVQYESKGLALAKQTIRIQPQINSSFFIGLVSPQRGALSLLNGLKFSGIRRPVVLFDLPLAQIPPRSEALRSLDALVINSTDTSQLSAEQVKAILGWVEQGGRLIIGGGALSLETLSGLQSLPLPVTVTNTQKISAVSGLLALAGEDQPQPAAGEYIVAAGALAPDARLLAGDPQQPLVAELQVNKGFINLATLDLASAPFEGWSGVTAFWQNLFGPSAIYPSWEPPDISSRQQMASQLGYALQNLPMLDIPSVKGLAILLGVYILVIGPLNYLVLRWKNRLHWAWITIPAITLVFSLSAFGLGYALHGADIFVNKIALIEAGPNGGVYTSFIGLFSPSQRSYEIEIPGSGLVSPLGPYYDPWNSFEQDNLVASTNEVRLVQSNPALVRGLNVAQWSMQSFMLEGIEINFGPIQGDLHLADGRLVGEIHNRSGHTLNDAVLIFSNFYQRLGDLDDGQSVTVDLEVTDRDATNLGMPIFYQIYETDLAQTGSQRLSRELDVKRTIVEALFQWGAPIEKSGSMFGQAGSSNLKQNPLLIGWLSDAPPQVRVNNEAPGQQSTALVFSSLPYQFLSSSGQINIPIGLVPGALVQTPVDGGTCGAPDDLSVYLFRGEAIFEFTMPADLKNAEISELKLGFWNDGSAFSLPEVYFFDYTQQDWQYMEDIVDGENILPDPANLISSEGLIRLRLNTVDATSSACYYIGLGMDGQLRQP